MDTHADSAIGGGARSATLVSPHSRSKNGIGTALRLQRERRRLSLETISRATMIRRDYLELIDADELERLPPGAYAKGFLRAYSSYLGLDPAGFVRAYEERCEQPAPELSSVVRHPVRVPNAARPRTWWMAAGGCVAALFVLGLLGVVRSNDRPAPPPNPSTAELSSVTSFQAAPADPDQPSANPAGAIVRIEVLGDEAWVQADEDGAVKFAGTLGTGQRRIFRGAENVYLIVGNAKSVKITANGRDVGTPPGTTYRGTFTPTTTELPPSQPR